MQDNYIIMESDTIWKRLFPWFWAASEERCLRAEDRILRGIEFKRRLVPVGNGFINTVEMGKHFEEKEKAHLNKALVMAPGFGAALGLFYKNFQEFSKHPGLKVYGIDWLGTGRSSRVPFNIKPGAEGSIEAAENFFVDSLEEWREQEGIEKMILFGHSLGGYLAATYAMKYPEHVEHLFLVSPAGVPSQTEEDRAQVSKWRDRAPFFFSMVKFFWEKNFTPQGLVRFAGPFGPRLIQYYTDRRFPDLPAEEAEALREYGYQYTARAGSGEYGMHCLLSFGAWARDPLINRAENIRTPATLLYGSQDWMDSNAGRALAMKLKEPASVKIIYDAGHHLYLDNPSHFNEAILDVIKSIQKRSQPNL